MIPYRKFRPLLGAITLGGQYCRTFLAFVARAVRQFDLVQQTPEDLGLADAAPTGETLLTLAGCYVGREFKFAGIRAVWTASQENIKFYGDDGEVLRVVEVGERQQAKAA